MGFSAIDTTFKIIVVLLFVLLIKLASAVPIALNPSTIEISSIELSPSLLRLKLNEVVMSSSKQL